MILEGPSLIPVGGKLTCIRIDLYIGFLNRLEFSVLSLNMGESTTFVTLMGTFLIHLF